MMIKWKNNCFYKILWAKNIISEKTFPQKKILLGKKVIRYFGIREKSIGGKNEGKCPLGKIMLRENGLGKMGGHCFLVKADSERPFSISSILCYILVPHWN